jgi:nitrate/nitrite-specific signal transduction histidine kinase
MSSGLTPHVSQIHLNYEAMENELRTMKDVLAVQQENHRETRESVNTFNAQIQAFLMVRNKNKFIAFLTFSDIYVCFTLFILLAMVQRIPDAGDLLVPTWQPLRQRSMPIPQWSTWPSSGSSAAQVSYNLAKLSQT